MIKLLHAGFDTIDVAFAGALPKKTLEILEEARQEAQDRQEPTLTTLGPGKVDAHVAGHGLRGGYAYVLDTGPVGAKWMIKHNTDSQKWNLFASPRATTLLAHGFEGTRDLLRAQLEGMGGRMTDHSINRVDFAMDFQTQAFELHQDQFVAHSHTKVMPHWSQTATPTADRNQPAAVLRGRRLESVTIGKQPGRQIIVYDKRREAIERQKPFWFKAWGVDGDDPTLEVWRVEVRAGKKELKDKYKMRTFADVTAGIGDVVVRALEDVRYLDDHQRDSNVSRQRLHPLWTAARSAAQASLQEQRSGLTPDQVLDGERGLVIDRHGRLCLGNAIALGAAKGLTYEEITAQLPVLIANLIRDRLHADAVGSRKAFLRAKEKQRFLHPF